MHSTPLFVMTSFIPLIKVVFSLLLELAKSNRRMNQKYIQKVRKNIQVLEEEIALPTMIEVYNGGANNLR